MASRFITVSRLLLLAPTIVAALIAPRDRGGLRRAPTTDRSTASRLRAVEEASFGMGCFWEPAEELLKVDGVIETVSGYTGNQKFDADPKKTVPSYDSVCYGRGWVEGVRVAYDADTISYEQLLDAFFEAQKPQPGSRQYGSVIFPHDERQLAAAEEWKSTSKQRESDGFKNDWTQIEYPRTKFYQAEGYHQNYWQKQRPRFALILAGLAVATGFGDQLYDPSLQETVKSVANGAVIVIGLAVTAERFLDSKVTALD
mmetsp:Transcript_12145/g.28817  ORF Transcript_12145/g.28817 Transcript_12145/m.28817 type:complete len:257 (-) Transcript_12145:1539-2309(-)